METLIILLCLEIYGIWDYFDTKKLIIKYKKQLK